MGGRLGRWVALLHVQKREGYEDGVTAPTVTFDDGCSSRAK